MGFLANHDFSTYESDLSDMIYGRTHRRALSDAMEVRAKATTRISLDIRTSPRTNPTPHWTTPHTPPQCACHDDSDTDGESDFAAPKLPPGFALPPSASAAPSPAPSTPAPGAPVNGWAEALQSLDLEAYEPPLDGDGLDVRLCRGTEEDEEGCAVLEEDEYGLPDEQLFPKAGVHVTIRLRLRCDVYKASDLVISCRSRILQSH